MKSSRRNLLSEYESVVIPQSHDLRGIHAGVFRHGPLESLDKLALFKTGGR
jgi:hypothetical protein